MGRPRKAATNSIAPGTLLEPLAEVFKSVVKDAAYWQAWIDNKDLIGPYRKIARQKLSELSK